MTHITDCACCGKTLNSTGECPSCDALSQGMELLKVTTVYNNICYVSVADYNHPTRFKTLVPLRFSTGRRYMDAPENLRPRGGLMLHRDNIQSVEPC